ncbi:MAG: hypothetical protein ABEJ70_00545 [Halobacteriaceae archaeon]
MARPSRSLTGQVVFGALVVLLGVLLLLRTTGVYDGTGLLVYVPSLFVLLGLYNLVRSGFRNVVGPTVLVLVAGAWQLVALDYLSWGEVGQFWPVFVILGGLAVLLGPLRRRRPPGTSEGVVTGFGLFGGVERRVTARAFEGADLLAVFGGVELDLRDAEVAERPAHVTATALFGGVEVIAPREWNVRMEVFPIFGGAEDERARSERTHEEVDLVVSGFVAFGGVSVSD